MKKLYDIPKLFYDFEEQIRIYFKKYYLMNLNILIFLILDEKWIENYKMTRCNINSYLAEVTQILKKNPSIFLNHKNEIKIKTLFFLTFLEIKVFSMFFSLFPLAFKISIRSGKYDKIKIVDKIASN